jgi:hypothetical protein
LFPKNAILFLEEINDVLLVLIDPTSRRGQQDMPGAQVVEHPVILRRMSFWTMRGSTNVPRAAASLSTGVSARHD